MEIEDTVDLVTNMVDVKLEEHSIILDGEQLDEIRDTLQIVLENYYNVV